MNTWSTEIENDLAWRESELASLKRMFVTSPDNSPQRTSLLRALCALLYAHYEGFCKNAWGIYVESISRKRFARSRLHDSFALLSMKSELLKIRTAPIEEIYQFCKVRFQQMLQEDSIVTEEFETSNLKPELLRQYCDMVLLPHKVLDEHDYLLRIMIGRRHEIAHGAKSIISSLEVYLQYERAAVLVMHELAVSVVDALDNQSYMK